MLLFESASAIFNIPKSKSKYDQNINSINVCLWTIQVKVKSCNSKSE